MKRSESPPDSEGVLTTQTQLRQATGESLDQIIERVNLGTSCRLTTGVPRGEVRGVQPPPLNLQNFLNCVFAKYTVSSAPILIKSYIFYRKTLKIVH